MPFYSQKTFECTNIQTKPVYCPAKTLTYAETIYWTSHSHRHYDFCIKLKKKKNNYTYNSIIFKSYLMNCKLKTFIVIAFIFNLLASSQTPIGYKFDLNALPLEGHFDPLTYNSDNGINIRHSPKTYEKGAFYDLQGNRTEGLFRYHNKIIKYKKHADSIKTEVRPADVSAVVVGVDSFIVVKNFKLKDRLRKEQAFAKFIMEIDGAVFVKYYHFTRI